MRSGRVDALAAWRPSGGRGEVVPIVDIESGSLPTHPDLLQVRRRTPAPVGEQPDDVAHTAEVLGGLCTLADGRGIVGLASDADVSLAQTSLEDERLHPLYVLRYAVSHVAPPAVVVMPMTVAPRKRDLTNPIGTPLEQLPLEVWSIGRAVLEVARRRGVSVVLAVGNEGHCLDDRMNLAPAAGPPTRSEASVAGEAEPSSNHLLDDSCRGTRVHLSALGSVRHDLDNRLLDGIYWRPSRLRRYFRGGGHRSRPHRAHRGSASGEPVFLLAAG